MVQENEVINLLMGLGALPALFLLVRHGQAPRLPLLYGAFLAIFAAQVFTIVEGFLWRELFNGLEHLSLALSGVLFCIALARLPRDLEREGKGTA